MILLSMGILLVACTPIAQPIDADPTAPAVEMPTADAMEETETTAETPEAAEEDTMTGTEEATAEATPANAAAPVDEPPIVQQVKADLAGRLSIDEGQIEVVDVRDVAWRDGSLGCPQPDMMYTQVIINGMKIILSVDGEEYHYHSGGNSEAFYCETPDPDGGMG